MSACTKRFGVTLRYPMVQMSRMRDRQIIARAQRAVSRLPSDPDTGAGPFCAKSKKCAPMRDIEMDFWRGNCGLEQHEVAKLKKAFKGSGIEVAVKPLVCCGSEPR